MCMYMLHVYIYGCRHDEWARQEPGAVFVRGDLVERGRLAEMWRAGGRSWAAVSLTEPDRGTGVR